MGSDRQTTDNVEPEPVAKIHPVQREQRSISIHRKFLSSPKYHPRIYFPVASKVAFAHAYSHHLAECDAATQGIAFLAAYNVGRNALLRCSGDGDKDGRAAPDRMGHGRFSSAGICGA